MSKSICLIYQSKTGHVLAAFTRNDGEEKLDDLEKERLLRHGSKFMVLDEIQKKLRIQALKPKSLGLAEVSFSELVLDSPRNYRVLFNAQTKSHELRPIGLGVASITFSGKTITLSVAKIALEKSETVLTSAYFSAGDMYLEADSQATGNSTGGLQKLQVSFKFSKALPTKDYWFEALIEPQKSSVLILTKEETR